MFVFYMAGIKILQIKLSILTTGVILLKHYIIKSKKDETYLFSGKDPEGVIFYVFDQIIHYSLLAKLFNDNQDWINADGATLMRFNSLEEVNCIMEKFQNPNDITMVLI